jgi:release factor glutamine methyltransferase
LQYEPRSALFGGDDGLFYIKKFLKQAKHFLQPNGKIFMEFSPEQKIKIGELLKKYNYKGWEFSKDQFDRARYVIIM